MRTALDKQLRRQLEAAVEKARDVAELAAKEELDRLGVGEKQAPDYLSPEQREQRNRLRAHGRFLGDIRRASGEQGVTLLVTEIAYEHWHRMLFSRFLAENNLLMYEDGVTALAISDCFDLAEEETGDSSNGWRYAAKYAAKMLPQIFRNDSPVLELEFSPNHQKKLEQLLEGLDAETFQAQDSLGWVYQFWQSKRKDEVNKSEVKIGAKELSPVTQLFTEPYMVSFLLDNALGAWWANQQLTDEDYVTAKSEDELRKKAAIDGVPLQYLRFIKTYTPEQQALIDREDGPDEKPEPQGPWEPAAGKFDQWPNELSELKTLDPCCGSGHFLVAVFLMLVPIRMKREGFTEQQAIDIVLAENIYGLELDQRCIEIAVFALALEAWRYPNSGGYRSLPEFQLACSGLSVKAANEEWKQLGLGKKNLTIALDWMHKEFSDAPVLGSLINPSKSNAANIVSWDELSTTLNVALEQETATEHNSEASLQSIEATVVAQGMAKAATMLAGKYHWVVTNVPYLGRGRQEKVLQDFSEKFYPKSKSDLSTTFLERCTDFCKEGGYVSSVTPQNWLFQVSYKNVREKLLKEYSWSFVVRLGVGAFETITGEVVKAALIGIRVENPQDFTEKFLGIKVSPTYFQCIDASLLKTPLAKSKQLESAKLQQAKQAGQLDNPDCYISFEDKTFVSALGDFGICSQGILPADRSRLVFFFWEHADVPSGCTFMQGSFSNQRHYNGRSQIFFFKLFTNIFKEIGGRYQGKKAMGKKGISITKMGSLPASIYDGSPFDGNAHVFTPNKNENLAAIFSFMSAPEFSQILRTLDQKRDVTNAVIDKTPFDLNYWSQIARKQYPLGLPQPYSDDPTQWTFHGHPSGSVIWNEELKKTSMGDLRIDETVLQVSLARLLGYQWPGELNVEMELAREQRQWVEKSKTLQSFVDDDGIVCLPAVRGEKSADERLEVLLQATYGDVWSATIRNQLLEAVGCTNKSLEFWLQERFFEQHCKIFQHRPFIWHIWDGLKDGFSALVNYHQLDKKNLERLIYTYLDDWIRTQSHQQSEGVDGANERLVAAQNLKQRLELILDGEAPYDIFVRWKPLEEQPIGWNPDLNDGVRLNIRPFMTAGVLRHNKNPRLNIHWKKDRGKDVESAPWYNLGLEYDGKEGDRINEHHLSLAEKQNAKA